MSQIVYTEKKRKKKNNGGGENEKKNKHRKGKWLEFSSSILMSSIEKLIKYVIGVERYAMQNSKCLGQKSNYINETHCEVLIYSQVTNRTI